MNGAGKDERRKCVAQDGGDSRRKRRQKQKASLLHAGPPKTLALDQLILTICCRYANSLLANAKVKEYLGKHHSLQLADLETLIEQCEQCVKQEGIRSVLLKSATRKQT